MRATRTTLDESGGLPWASPPLSSCRSSHRINGRRHSAIGISYNPRST